MSRLLAGYRDRPPADRPAIVRTLLALSQIAIEFPLVRSIDINPLLADADGVIALDARIEIDPRRAAMLPPSRDLAVRPYPSGWVSQTSAGGLDLTIRPIRPEDADLYPRYLERTDPEDMRMRFLVPMRALSKNSLVRLTQLDYDRDIAFVALERASGDLAGIARYAADPDRNQAEFAILIRSDLKGRGIGRALMGQLIGYAKAEGIGELYGHVLRENDAMFDFCRKHGFTLRDVPDDPTMMRAELTLAPTATGA